jgi:hypothetical protein
MRWIVTQQDFPSVQVDDLAEVFLSGTHVPGVWVLGKVKKIKKGKYFFEDICTSSNGMLSVTADRVRPAKMTHLLNLQSVKSPKSSGRNAFSSRFRRSRVLDLTPSSSSNSCSMS